MAREDGAESVEQRAQDVERIEGSDSAEMD